MNQTKLKQKWRTKFSAGVLYCISSDTAQYFRADGSEGTNIGAIRNLSSKMR
jgi:hypothetical protein